MSTSCLLLKICNSALLRLNDKMTVLVDDDKFMFYLSWSTHMLCFADYQSFVSKQWKHGIGSTVQFCGEGDLDGIFKAVTSPVYHRWALAVSPIAKSCWGFWLRQVQEGLKKRSPWSCRRPWASEVLSIFPIRNAHATHEGLEGEGNKEERKQERTYLESTRWRDI